LNKRSTLLTAAGILIAIGSCLALVVSFFMFYLLQLDFSFGWRFDADLLARIVIGAFGLSAFVLGLISARQVLVGKKIVVSIIGATLVLLVGSTFFIRMILPLTTRLDYPLTWWTTLIEYVIFPLVVFASLGLGLLIARRREFDCIGSIDVTVLNNGCLARRNVLCLIPRSVYSSLW
jgi:hypothetical protein